MEFYKNRKAVYELELKKLTTRYNIISASRLLMAIGVFSFGYYAFNAEKPLVFTCLMLFCAVEFVLLMNRHALVRNRKLRAGALVKINQEEMDYLDGKSIPFDNGKAFIDFTHPYSHDLDVFGDRSLYHNLNRAQSYRGSIKLAESLTQLLPIDDILLNQEAVKELAGKLEFRQEIMALSRVNKESEDVYQKLMLWTNGVSKNTPLISNLTAYILPISFVVSVIAYIVTSISTWSTAAEWLFGFNLLFILFHVKAIKAEMKDTTEIDNIIHHYGLIIEQIEKEPFSSEKLKAIQAKLNAGEGSAGKKIKKLAIYFSRLDSMDNVFGAALMNGVMLYHFYAFKSLLKWKKENAAAIAGWLEVIAEIEALGSLGNLYYNNPDFTFPTINTNYKIEFKGLAHPLLNKENRVRNDITFDSVFMILTGSNMSGKSTFLRSLGINMVLAGAGAPVCASAANVHPLPVLVSMRLSDSLSDNESYFFAEVKRLRYIMDQLADKMAFVLLDEILRGTNSDDKRTGTVKVIRKMIALNAAGAIATHDIEVCELAKEYPSQLVNRCFEAQIENNELYFDYCLRDGICRNKSATFFMEKMGVI
ncbi:DNA mismatch repair protein [Flavobacterium sp. DG1-102-2]|uniref:MutS-related protein n=1 Tax=Flavobacterium sp. DG1-102-2 TaxID=3081663 RepID=UPI002949738E|nr:DNA mismatch repair protein [Flavobacterium sp. DG1-102-2]MDV6167098.1 DNA mismatch repair protein [Flavobacterium sp. DG1-102-2]